MSGGRLHPELNRLLVKEVQAMREWIVETFECKGLTMVKHDGTHRLARSVVEGCLRFGDGDEFIRFETKKQREVRHRKAERQRARRIAKKEREERARDLAEREGLT